MEGSGTDTNLRRLVDAIMSLSADLDLGVVLRRLAEAAAKSPQPELHLRADQNTRYQKLAEVMSQARTAGIEKMGFITVPQQP